MAFYRAVGGAKRSTYFFPKKASQAFVVNSLLTFSGGEVQPAVSTDTRIAGICQQKITSADSDYASETPIGVELIDTDGIYIGDVTTGSLTTESVGIQYDLDSATGVNVSATSHKQVTCVGYISATKGYFMINGAFQVVNAV